MPHSAPSPETPEELRDFEQVLKRLLRLPPPQAKPARTLDRRAARLARAKKARRQVSSSA